MFSLQILRNSMKWPRQPILPQNSAFFWMTTVNFLLWIKLVIKLERITSQKSFSFSTSRLLLHHHQLSLRIFFSHLKKFHLWLLSVWINTSRINKINAKAKSNIWIFAPKINILTIIQIFEKMNDTNRKWFIFGVKIQIFEKSTIQTENDLFLAQKFNYVKNQCYKQK